MKISKLSLSSRSVLVFGLSLGLGACSSVGVPGTGASNMTVQAGMTDASMTVTTSADSARYEVRFVPSWNPATHPLEYPLTHGKKGLLTPAIGATHGSNYSIFASGTKPTAGLEKLSETGMPTPLDMEIESAIEKGDAKSVIRFAGGSPGPVHSPIGTTFEISKNAPLVSIVGMIAPSPDWFYGASSVELRKNGRWVPNRVVTVYAWDSGGDAGTTYLAKDQDLNPKQATRMAASPQFVRDGRSCPVGYFVFKQIPAEN
jgi:Spondin_N